MEKHDWKAMKDSSIWYLTLLSYVTPLLYRLQFTYLYDNPLINACIIGIYKISFLAQSLQVLQAAKTSLSPYGRIAMPVTGIMRNILNDYLKSDYE